MKEEFTEEIYLKEFWNNTEMYRGLKQRDLTILKNLTYPEWMARTNIVDQELVGRMLVELGYIEDD